MNSNDKSRSENSAVHEKSEPTITGAISAPLVQAILSYQRSMATGDYASARAVFDPEVEYIVPGQNALSGTYRGGDAVMGYFDRLMRITAGTYSIAEMEWLVCGEQVVLETRNAATIGARKLSWDEAVVFEFKNGLKHRIRLFQADQVAVDAFIGR